MSRGINHNCTLPCSITSLQPRLKQKQDRLRRESTANDAVDRAEVDQLTERIAQMRRDGEARFVGVDEAAEADVKRRRQQQTADATQARGFVERFEQA